MTTKEQAGPRVNEASPHTGGTWAARSITRDGVKTLLYAGG